MCLGTAMLQLSAQLHPQVDSPLFAATVAATVAAAALLHQGAPSILGKPGPPTTGFNEPQKLH